MNSFLLILLTVPVLNFNIFSLWPSFLFLTCFYSQSISCDLFSNSSFGESLHDVNFSKQPYYNWLQNYLNLTADDHNCSQITLMFYVIPLCETAFTSFLPGAALKLPSQLIQNTAALIFNASNKFRFYINASLQKRNYSQIWVVAITSVHKISVTLKSA